MKSFSVFMEDVATAKAEADAREKRSTDLTQTSRKKSKTKRKIVSQLFQAQRERAEKLKKRTEIKRQNAKADFAKNRKNVTQAVKGTVKLVKQVARAVKNKKQNPTPSP
jgi:hypothetical protein